MTGRFAAVLLALALAVVVAISVVLAAARGALERHLQLREIGFGQVRYRDAGPERWAARWRRERRVVVELRRRLRREQYVLLHRGDVVEAINLACATYGQCSTLWRKARCETGGTFDPGAANGSGASGLFQFLPSTWRSTPYAVFSVWSPYANALAAGWMHEQGRGGEWSCR